MAKSQRQIAEMTGVDKHTVLRKQKELPTEEAVIEKCKEIGEKKKAKRKTVESMDEEFVPNVRRINENSGSSIEMMLQDCKEQYVTNQEIIKRLEHELSFMGKMTSVSHTGSYQVAPQLGIIEKYLKVNISLRNQITALEEKLGIEADEKEDNPFE